MCQGMEKGANFCATLLLLYHTSNWLNQQNLPKLQLAVYIFIHNWLAIFLSTKSFPSLNTCMRYYHINPMRGTLENWKLLLSLFTTIEIGLNVLTQRKLPFKIELKNILFHKPGFHRLIHSLYENTTIQCGESILPHHLIIYPHRALWRIRLLFCGFLNIKCFTGKGYWPFAQPPTWRARCCNSSDLSPGTSPARLNLPGTCSPSWYTSASRVTKACKPPHHDNLDAALREDIATEHRKTLQFLSWSLLNTLMECFMLFCFCRR